MTVLSVPISVRSVLPALWFFVIVGRRAGLGRIGGIRVRFRAAFPNSVRLVVNAAYCAHAAISDRSSRLGRWRPFTGEVRQQRVILTFRAFLALPFVVNNLFAPPDVPAGLGFFVDIWRRRVNGPQSQDVRTAILRNILRLICGHLT